MTPYERALQKLDQSGGPDACWEWTGPRHSFGYGLLGGKHYVHRIVAEHHAQRPLTSNDFVCHRCDNPPCANPRHLFVGTPSDNQRDMTLKGRAARQVDVNIDALLWLYERHVSIARIAELLGVSEHVVGRRLRARGLTRRRGQQTLDEMAEADDAVAAFLSEMAA